MTEAAFTALAGTSAACIVLVLLAWLAGSFVAAGSDEGEIDIRAGRAGRAPRPGLVPLYDRDGVVAEWVTRDLIRHLTTTPEEARHAGR